MEIYSLRAIGNFLHKNEGRNQRDQATASETSAPLRSGSFADHVDEAAQAFAAITPRELRSRAQDSYAAGEIDQETYSQLAAGLPLEAIDEQGRVMDLSNVTDDTPFDFQGFYRSQMEIALNVGDLQSASVLRSVVTFLGG